jgi:hypothetical protein
MTREKRVILRKRSKIRVILRERSKIRVILRERSDRRISGTGIPPDRQTLPREILRRLPAAQDDEE